MKTQFSMTLKAALAAGLATGLALTAAAQAPKKVLVVTTTLGFRHSSIPTAEKVLNKLGLQSRAYTVEYVHQPEMKVGEPRKPKALAADADETARAKHEADQAKYEADLAKYKAAKQVFDEAMRKALQKLGPESLQNYDAVIFANTTGDLPLPDRQGFLDWIKSGKAFIGMHSCIDTFHGWPDFIKMLGGEFASHGAQVGVDCLNQDPKHPANVHLPNGWKITQEEMYLIKNYDLEKCNHDLLILDKHPNKPEEAGRFPVSWCKEYGKGRVFYTTLGHREDIWDDEWKEGNGRRANAPAIALAYQQHILGGIKWAMHLDSDIKP